MPRVPRLALIAFFAAALCSCGGEDDDDGLAPPPAPAAVARVRILQTGLILTGAGDTRQLSAVAYDAEGNTVSVPVTWHSTHPGHVAVDSGGLATAVSSSGSSQIVAQAGGVISLPLLAVATVLPAGAVPLSDGQIVGEPAAAFPGDPPSFFNTYEVVLTGVAAPALGTLLVNTDSKPVVGRVVSVDTAGGQMKVTLRLVSMREAFPDLNINQVLDLSRADIVVDPAAAAAYDVQRAGDELTFTPRVGAAMVSSATQLMMPKVSPFAATVEVAGGFECELSGTDTTLPFQLGAPPLITIGTNLSYELVYTEATGLELLVVHGEVSPKIQYGISVTAAVEAKVGCELDLFKILVPLGGPLSLFVGAQIPVKAGFEVGGKLTVATAGVSIAASAKRDLKIGVACPGGGACALVLDGEGSAELTPDLDLPGLGDVRFEPELGSTGTIELQLGVPFLPELQFGVAEAHIGPRLKGSFALVDGQILDGTYKSDYSVTYEIGAGAGAGLGSASDLLGISLPALLESKAEFKIGRSPEGTLSADKASFIAGDTVNFTVQLDPATIDFIPVIGPYNVHEVVIYRRKSAALLETADEVARVGASSGQTIFEIPWTAPDSGTTAEFSAFVVTTLLPVDLLALELGQAQPAATGVILQSRVGVVSSQCHARAVADDGGESELVLDDDKFHADPQMQPLVPASATALLSASRVCDAMLAGANAAASVSASQSLSESFGASSVADVNGITELTGLGASVNATAVLSANVGTVAQGGELTAEALAQNTSHLRYSLSVPAGTSALITVNMQASSLTAAAAEVRGLVPGESVFMPGSGVEAICPGRGLDTCSDLTAAQRVFGPFTGPATVTVRVDAVAGDEFIGRGVRRQSQEGPDGFVVTTDGEAGSWTGTASASFVAGFTPSP